MLLNNQWITEEIKKEIKKIPRDKWKQKHNDPKSMVCSKSSSKREVYSDTSLRHKTRKISSKQTNLTTEELEKEEQIKSKVERKKK